MNKTNHHTPKVTERIPPWLWLFDAAVYEQTITGLNRDTENNSAVANLYEQDKAAIQTGFAIGRSLGQNFNSFMAIMASDMDKAGKEAAVGKDGKPLIDVNGQPVLGKDGKPITVKEAYQDLNLRDQLGVVNVDGQKIDYGVRQSLWGSGGTGNILATAVVGAFSGNVTGGASELIKNTAINVVRAYGATEIKEIADGFMDVKDGKLQANGTSETVRGLLHAIAGCAGASATGGDCASAAVASGATVAMNNAMGALLNLDPATMTEEQKQAYSNLMGTLVSGVTSAVGGDAVAAGLAAKIEVDDNRSGLSIREGQLQAQDHCARNPNASGCKDNNDGKRDLAYMRALVSACSKNLTICDNVEAQARQLRRDSRANPRAKGEMIQYINQIAQLRRSDAAKQAEAARVRKLNEANQVVLSNLGLSQQAIESNGGKGANIGMASDIAGIPREKPLTDKQKETIANGAAAVSSIAGKTSDYATATGATCALAPDVTITKGCAVVMSGTAVTADVIDYGARAVEQLVRPNTGQVIVDGLGDGVAEVTGHIPKIGPVLAPAIGQVTDIVKETSVVKDAQQSINDLTK